MYNFKKNKISLGVLFLLFSIQAHAEDVNIEPPKYSVLVDKRDISIRDVSGIYNVQFNKEFTILADVVTDGENLYISTKYLDDKIKTKFSLDKIIVQRNSEPFIVVNKSMVHKIDDSEMNLSIILTSELFNDSSTIKRIKHVERNITAIDSANVVNYLNNNYQFSLDDGKNLSGYVNTKYSNKDYWSIQNKTLYRDKKFVRLSTVYKKEFDDKSALEIGDVFEENMGQMASVNGFGFKFSTNYFNNNTNSNVNDSLPQYSINGFSLTPSTFNLQASSNAIISDEIKSGNYSVIMPYNNGFGTYSGFIKDYLGNTQAFDIPYYNSKKLVKDGKFEYSVTAASIRKNQYTNSFEYEKPFVSAITKYGVNDNWTQDFSLHYSTYYKNIYAGANFYIDPSWGLFNAGVNYNGDNQKLYNLGWEHYSNSPFNFKINSSISNDPDGFCMKYINDCIKKQNRVSVGYRLPSNLGNLSYQYLQDEKKSLQYSTNSINWSKKITNQMNLTLIYEDVNYKTARSEQKFLALLSYSFDDKYSASANYQNTSNYDSYQARFSRSEDRDHPEYGYGYANISKNTTQKNPNYSLNYFANLDKFSYNVQATNTNDKWNSRVGIRGAALYVPEDNSLNFTKDINGVILVDTDKKEEQKNDSIDIYHQNKLAGRTDSDGKYIITKGVPYLSEKVELNLSNLPLDRNFEQFKYDVVVPEYGAAKVKFKQVMADYPITVTNLPLGAIFNINDTQYVIGKDGETSVDQEGLATFTSGNNTCKFTVKIGITNYSCN